MFSKSPKPVKFARCVRTDDDAIVNPHLAYDLSTLDEMRRQGRPISIPNAENLYYDGSEDCSFNLPLDSQRGVDINDMWNRAKSIGKKLSKLGASSVDVNPSK